MSTTDKYRSLKTEGTWKDRLDYVLSLPDKSEMENYLQKSSSHDDLQVLIVLLKSMKNERMLFELSKTDSLPIRQRIFAAKGWLKIQNDEEKIYTYIVDMITDKNIPRLFKSQILKDLHHHDSLNKSSSFFYRLVCHLTETYQHQQFNLDAYLVPFCSTEQIIDILSRWSIQRFEQIDRASLFRSKLIVYQPAVVVHLIRCDLLEKRTHPEETCQYFQEHYQLFLSCAQKDPKAVCRLVIDYLQHTEHHRRFLPYFIFVKQKYFFKKAPDEMIELISLIGIHEPGKIQYQTAWCRKGSDLEGFIFPRSFSIDHYVRLFTVLYETCRWSSSYTLRLFQYLLRNSHEHFGLSSIRKRRIWLIDIVIHRRIGHEIFLEKLLAEGDETTLKLFVEYPELTTPFSVHLISQHELNRSLSAKRRLSLLRYQLMTDELFSQFQSLCSQNKTNKQQRQQNYTLFFQCALASNEEHVKNVLQYLLERFTHAPLPMIEHFIRSFTELNNRFHLEILPKNFLVVRAIIELAVTHLQQSINTRQMIVEYGLLLLQRVEFHPNKGQRAEIQAFACEIMKRCFTINPTNVSYPPSLSESYRMARHLLADILISEVFPTLLSKCLIDDLNDMLHYVFEKPWKVPKLDAFLESFFTDYLLSSTKLQSVFQVSRHSSMITSYLKIRSTRLKRVHQLIDKLDEVFFLNHIVQQAVLRSRQYRTFIDQYLAAEKLSDVQYPGFHIEVLNTSFYYLTGRQQEHITKIILNHFIQAKDVTNSNKLKSLRVLGHLTHTYKQSLPWVFLKQTFPAAMKNHTRRTVQSLDDLIICVPVSFHLTRENLLQQFRLLKNKLNAASAKYVSDAMLIISRRISDDEFLKHYLELVHDESFQKLGITANKEIFRLLTEFTTNSSLLTSVIKPFWESRPHQDVRACLILTLLHFTDKVQSNEEKTVLWNILEQAATDTYLPVIQSLFSASRGNSRWPLHQLRNSSNSIYSTFVNRIQYRILDHPTSLEARVWAWQNIDDKYCHSEEFIGKGKELLLQFDQNGNTLWELAFQKILSSFDTIVDIIKRLMSGRDKIDTNSDDLPVYHRIHSILKILIHRIDQFDSETKLTFRSLASMILQFDETFAVLIGTLSIRIAADKDDLQSLLILLGKNLSKNYFDRVLIQLASILPDTRSPSFLRQYTVNEKLNFARWFIQDKDQGLFVFDLLKKQIFSAKEADREQCQTLLRQLRQSDNLLLRQQAREYVVPWKPKKENLRRKSHPTRIKTDRSDQETLDLNIFDTFHQ